MLENINTITDLKTAIQTINVKDYGDFKRKAVLYINRFLETHPTSATQKKMFSTMVYQIQFQPNFDIEKTRAYTLQQLRTIEKN
ncbi:MAG: hypothetical protein K2Q26_05780 [Bdellovibrionales bacterium]|nr:hypothetical protein [Bdellovibrionales bacterium]